MRSFPAALALVLPKTTPSGLSIGIIKKLHLFLKSYAYLLEPIKYKIKPLRIKELLDSPGCTLPVRIMFFFLNSLDLWLDMCNIGKLRPVSVLPAILFFTKVDFWYC